jgi:polysaccharide pyruvyl transferase WcaK-like protein
MKILVYGWYHQSNIGDDLFANAFRKLFPNYEFVYHNSIRLQDLRDIDAVFFGGGSFLLEEPLISGEVFAKLKTMPIFYLGVGAESEIHPTHMTLISLAKMVATRSPSQVDKLKLLNPNVIAIPDLVYSLQSQVKLSEKLPRSVLVMPNVSVLPSHMEPYWKHASWSHFKSEFAQFLDILRKDGFKVDFLSMCQSRKDNDDWAAGEIIGHMSCRGKLMLDEQPVGIEQVTKLISKYSIVITQRFHGIVLSEMTKTPYIAIHHHDKLKHTKPSNGSFLSYYNASKQSFFDAFNSTMKLNFDHTLPIEPNIFEAFSQKIIELVENGSIYRNQTK